eukprot:gnl/TRDRNA2_/TRDRNA2_37033_c1_seq1.p1 gnl/TRDRNA2_/TRDRNA2_37033_c1~~gnl/TRDRNA2_/TRDRNA2_37033_c1_seq1.p1  ORF type:complete len:422 (+),score=101.97 gnl/TRDRNA2_/TRDRNA2_37033_c1_seq1:97-1266(+)
MSAATEDHENIAIEDQSEMKIVEAVENCCKEVGFTKDDVMGRAEFNALLRTHEMHLYMQYFGLTRDMTEHLFFQLSGNGETEVQLHFFLTVAGKMKGAAKSADMLLVLYPLQRLSEKVKVFIGHTVRSIAELERKFDTIPQLLQEHHERLSGSHSRRTHHEPRQVQSPEAIQMMTAAGRTQTNVSGGSVVSENPVADVPASRPGPGASLSGDKVMEISTLEPEPAPYEEQDGEPVEVMLKALKALRAEVVALADLGARAEVQAAKVKAEEVERAAAVERENIAKDREELMRTVGGAWRAMRSSDDSTMPSSGGFASPRDDLTPRMMTEGFLSAENLVDFNLRDPSRRAPMQPPVPPKTQVMRQDETPPTVERTCAPAEATIPFCIGRRG